MTVVAVVSQKSQAAALTRWAWRVAQAQELDLVVLWVEKGSETSRAVPVRPEDADDTQLQEGGLPEILSTLDALGVPLGQEDVHPSGVVKRLVHSDRQEGVLREVELSGARWLIAGQPPGDQRDGRQLGRRLFRRAPCAMLLLRPGTAEEQPCHRILVPTSGGASSAAALSLGARLAEVTDGELTPLYVEQASDEMAEAVGRRILDNAVATADLRVPPEGGSWSIEPRVELADSEVDGVEAVAGESFDLVLLGASHRGFLRRKLFSSVPECMLASAEPATVGVVRGPKPPARRLQALLEQALDLSIPQLERDDRVSLVEKLQVQSRWNFDFLALISLSTLIAALGLLQDSAAVVIGAMLVAPLMTPLLGAGLALVQGNLPLMRTAGQAIVFGFLIAVAIGFAVGALVPLPELTSQLEARGAPTLLDLGVAFFSGIAAAYCLGRPNLSAALPGVAIAAALVPPIATLGISLALDQREVARGAAILFGTNVATIILGAATSFFGAGIRSNRRLTRKNRWARAVLVVLVLAVALLAIPLASLLIAQISAVTQPRGVSEELQTALEQELERHAPPGSKLSSAVWDRRGDDPALLVLRVTAPQPPSRRLIGILARRAAEVLEEPVHIRLRTELVAEGEAGPEGAEASPEGVAGGFDGTPPFPAKISS